MMSIQDHKIVETYSLMIHGKLLKSFDEPPKRIYSFELRHFCKIFWGTINSDKLKSEPAVFKKHQL